MNVTIRIMTADTNTAVDIELKTSSSRSKALDVAVNNNNPHNKHGDLDCISDNSDSDVKETIPWYGGNLTPWWFLCTVYMVLFVIYLGFRAFGDASVTFAIHTTIAFVFIICCTWNLIHTPSQGKRY